VLPDGLSPSSSTVLVVETYVHGLGVLDPAQSTQSGRSIRFERAFARADFLRPHARSSHWNMAPMREILEFGRAPEVAEVHLFAGLRCTVAVGSTVVKTDHVELGRECGVPVRLT